MMRRPLRVALAASLLVLCQDAAFAAIRDVREPGSGIEYRGYERGEYALTVMHWDDTARKLTIAPRRGTFPGMKTKRRFKVVGVGHDGKATDLVYDGRAVTIRP
jgi:hypothetical protein